MKQREKLIGLLNQNCGYVEEQPAEILADYLIANGVTIPVRCDECKYYNRDKDMCSRQVCMSTHKNGFCDFGKAKEDTK